MRYDYYIIILIGFLMGCHSSGESDAAKKGDLLAQVGDKSLYLSDLKSPNIEGSSEDSLSILNSYVEQWVRRMVVIDQAEKSLPPDININELVKDYRASLILHNYRADIIDKKLDTLVSNSELRAYYDEYKDQYILSEPILKGIIVKVPKETKGRDLYYSKWKKNDFDYIYSYAKQKASFSLLDTSRWYSINEFHTYLPTEAFPQSKFNSVKDFRDSYEEYEYFVKILSYVRGNEPPPLSYMEDKIRKLIINERKKTLLDDIENSLYENALNANNIKVYTK